MKQRNKPMQMALMGILCAAAVAGSTLSFPVLGSRCAPVQHMVNVLAGVMLGPWHALGAAFCASLLRNLFGLGSLLAFPGSMCGALLCGMVYRRTKQVRHAVLGEMFGTGVLGGLLAYPVAVAFMGVDSGEAAFYAYIVPFLVSAVAGACLSGVIISHLDKAGIVQKP